MDAKTSPTNVAPHVLLTVALTRTIVDESLEEVSSEEKAYSRGPEDLKGPGAAMSWKFWSTWKGVSRMREPGLEY